MTSDSNAVATRRTTWPAWLAATGLALPLIYVGSLAPLWRLAQPSRQSGFHRFYHPAYSIMQHTPLRAPLLAWCATWGVRDKVERYLERQAIEGIFDAPTSTGHL